METDHAARDAKFFAKKPKSLADRRAEQKCRALQAKISSGFPKGFKDETYLAWERDYKWSAHQRWEKELGRSELKNLLSTGQHAEAAARAIRIESRTNLLFSFEKIAVRDAVRDPNGAKLFAQGLADLVFGSGRPEERLQRWGDAVAALPRKQTRVLTWPVLTVFPFLADPQRFIFLKPTVTRTAAENYGFEFHYNRPPDWNVYQSLMDFAETVRRDLADLRPRDMIDLQSFIWVQGSDEY